MQDENLSQWFNLDEQKPWDPGVYEVEFKSIFDGANRIAKSFFDGEKFNFLSHEMYGFSAEKAFEKRKCCGGGRLVFRWRGLASDPNAKPKARGNRKVTRYVVMESLLVNDRAVASFEKRKAADAYLKMNPGWPMLPNYIKKIRFRTPEAD